MFLPISHKQRAYLFGQLAEIQAIIFLSFKGYIILARRYRTMSGEIDIIARRGKIIVFIEVKARRNSDYFNMSLTHRQQQRIIRTAYHFIRRYTRYKDHQMRFDIMLCNHLLKKPRHITQAW